MARYRYVEQELGLIRRSGSWNPRVQRILKAAPLVFVFLLLNARSARSATCSFNPTPDPTVDGSPTSLRHAIQMANASGQDCLITLAKGTYTLTIKNTNGHENDAAQGDLDIADSGHTVTIQGQGAASSIVNGNGIDRVFDVLGGADAVFSNLMIEGGIARDDGTPGALPGTTESDGGGVLIQDGGQVILSDVWVELNYALGANGANGTARSLNGSQGTAGAGGGIYISSGTVNLSNGSLITRNAATGGNGGNGLTSAIAGNGGNGQTGSGGGIYIASGSINLDASTISSNTVRGGSGGNGGLGTIGIGVGGAGGDGQTGLGGGLYVSSGTISLARSTISSNSATGGGGGSGGDGEGMAGSGVGGAGGNAQTGAGGGVYFSFGAAKMFTSTVSNNTASSASGGAGGFGGSHGGNGPEGYGGPSLGGGMLMASGNASLANSTFVLNAAKNGGAGSFGGESAGGALLISGGTVNLLGVTIASNHAFGGGAGSPQGSSLGGGIANAGATSLISNTTLIGNNVRDSSSSGAGPDVSGAITSSYSLISDTAGATISDNGHNIFNVNPELDPGGLRSNGGPTETVALEPGSPAIDAGDNVICQAPPPEGLGGVDQRGFPRSRPCDIGAFELPPTPTPTSTPIPTPTRIPTPTFTRTPTATSTAKPTPTSTAKPTPTPTRKPTPTPTKKPTVTPTKKPTPTFTRKPTPTPTRKPTATPTVKPTFTRTPKPTATPIIAAPFIESIPKVILVGDKFNITGEKFTTGSEVNLFVATASGVINGGPLIPVAHSLPTQLTVNVPATVPLGSGFAEVQVVNTDTGDLTSNSVPALLQGSPMAGIPSITAINGLGLATTSSDPSYATNNVETVVVQGKVVTLGGTGFDTANGVAVDLFCACTGGKVGPFFFNPGGGFSTTSISFTLPPSGPNPATGPGSFVVSNRGADGKYSKKSNAVSVPIGKALSISSVSQAGSTIRVSGTGFSTLTVINFFNAQAGGVVNLGGLGASAKPRIPLTVINSDRFTFTVPARAVSDAAYVQAVNPPFVPYSNSGSGPGGSFTLK